MGSYLELIVVKNHSICPLVGVHNKFDAFATDIKMHKEQQMS